MKLKTYMRNKNLTANDVAKGTGISVSGINKLLQGHRFPRPSTLEKISKFTDGSVTANDFYSNAA